MNILSLKGKKTSYVWMGNEYILHGRKVSMILFYNLTSSLTFIMICRNLRSMKTVMSLCNKVNIMSIAGMVK